MAIKNTLERYGSVAKAFHWLIAAMIIGLLVVGFIMEDMAPGDQKWQLYGLHKATGIVVLTLVFLRFSWRSINVAPAMPNSLSAALKKVALFAHMTLYALMFLMPISGWGMSSAGGHPISFYGLFTVPPLVEKDPVLGSIFSDLHATCAWLFVAAISLHILAALLHHFYFKDDTLKRMI